MSSVGPGKMADVTVSYHGANSRDVDGLEPRLGRTALVYPSPSRTLLGQLKSACRPRVHNSPQSPERSGDPKKILVAEK